MNRRDALTRVALLMGGAVSAPALTGLLSGCQPETKAYELGWKPAFLSEEQGAMVAEISELIIPTTSTPGAKTAGVPQFVDLMLKDCYPEKDKKSFKDGLDQLNTRAKDAYDKAFLESTPAQQTELLKKLEKEAADSEKAKKDREAQIALQPRETQPGGAQAGAAQSGRMESGSSRPMEPKTEEGIPFFKMMKELTLLGYFTSEPGATKALAYVPVPGKFEGCVPLKPGQKAWAL